MIEKATQAKQTSVLPKVMFSMLKHWQPYQKLCWHWHELQLQWGSALGRQASSTEALSGTVMGRGARGPGALAPGHAEPWAAERPHARPVHTRLARGQPEPALKDSCQRACGWPSGCAGPRNSGVCVTVQSTGDPFSRGCFSQLPIRAHHSLPTRAHIRGREELGGGGKWEKGLPRKTLAPQLGGA